MNKPLVVFITLVVGLSVLASIAPTLTVLANAAVPLIIAFGCVVIVVRLVWYYTGRY